MAARKGFTLVELLTVIIILGLVGLIAIPSITRLLGDSKEKLYNKQVEFIVNASREWGVENIDQIPSTGKTYVSVDNLIKSGYIEQNSLKDPRNTKEEMNGCVVIEYNEPYDKYEYKYDEKTCVEIDENRNMTSVDPQYVCYNFDETTGTIVHYDVDNTNCLSDVVMPNKIDGVVVKHIAGAAFINATTQTCHINDGDIDNVVAFNYVRQAGDGYDGCWYNYGSRALTITSVVLPKYVETIGVSAFADGLITSLDFTGLQNLTAIYDDAFYGNAINTVTFDDVPKLESIGSYSLSENSITNLDLSSATGLKVIGNETFAWNHIIYLNLQDLANLTNIGYSAFEDNIIRSVTIPGSVTSIGDYAFSGNPLTSVTIEGDNKIRFNGRWTVIGFPSSLMSSVEITEVATTLSTATPNNFSFNYAYYRVTVPTTGNYQFEVWGAKGGNAIDDGDETIVQGGNGAYSSGNYYLTAGQTIYVYVGGMGESAGDYGAGGGGASEIRTSKALTSPLTASERLIVAGGGGGASCGLNSIGGYGGGGAGGNYNNTELTSRNGTATNGGNGGPGGSDGGGGGGASPNGGGGGGNGDNSTTSSPDVGGIGGFGGPASGTSQYGLGGVNSNNWGGAGGGGGGWLGGGGGGDNETDYSVTYRRGYDGTALGGGTAGGGANFIYNGRGGTTDGLGGAGGRGDDGYDGGAGGYNGGGGGANYSGGGAGGGGGYYGGGGGGGYCGGGGGGSSYIGGVTSGQTIAGNSTMPNPNGGTMTGNSGIGYARITYLGA